MERLGQIMIGWREWATLPELGLESIQAKVDTGAKTSALHAFNVEEFYDKGQRSVRFLVHPLPNHNNEEVIECVANVYDVRSVSDSGGHTELRYVIKTPLQFAHIVWPVEITLTNRDSMRFRLLIGRSALQAQPFMIDPTASFLLSNNQPVKT